MVTQQIGPAPDDVEYGSGETQAEVTPRSSSLELPTRDSTESKQSVAARQHQPPEGITVPSRGWPKCNYTLYRDAASGIPTSLSHSQWRTEIVEDLKRFIAQGVRPVISITNIKSGTKTRTATYLAAMLSRFGNLRVLVLPTTMDTATATLALAVGFEDGDTLTLDDLVVRRHEFKRYFALTSQLKKFTIDGFMVAAEGINDVTQEGTLWTVPEWIEMLRIVRSHFDVIILDHANDSLLAGSIGQAAVRMSDLVILMQNAKEKVTKTTLKKTFNGYKTDPFMGLTAAEIVQNGLVGMYEGQPEKLMLLPGELVPMWDKIKSAIVVTSRSTPQEWPTERVKEVLHGRSDSDAQSSQVREWNGLSRTIPDDSYIRQDGSICDSSKLGSATFDKFLDLAVLVMAKASVVKEQSDRVWDDMFADIERARQSLEQHGTIPGLVSTGTAHRPPAQ